MARVVYSTGAFGKPDSDRPGSGQHDSDRPGDTPGTDRTSTARIERSSQQIRVSRDRSGRRGKTVTVAGPFRLPEAEVADLLRALKKRCGAGGAVKPSLKDSSQWTLELQGDRVDDVLAWLAAEGFPAKQSGG